MPNLPEVNETFDADSSGYVRAIEEAIAATERFISSVGDAITKVEELQAAMNALKDKDIKVTVDTAQAMSTIATVKGAIASIPEEKTVHVNVIYTNTGAPDVGGEDVVRTVRTVFTSEGDNNAGDLIRNIQTINNVTVNVDGNAVSKLTKINKMLDALPDEKTITVDVKYRTDGGASAPDLKTLTEKISETINVKTEGLQQVNNELNSTFAKFNELKKSAEDAAASIKNTADSIRRESAGASSFASAAALGQDVLIRQLNNGEISSRKYAMSMHDLSISQINGARAATLMGGAAVDQAAKVGVVAGWWRQWGTVVHWVIAAGAEFLATFIPAMVAAAAAAAVMIQAGQNIYQRMSAVYTVAEALGPAINKTAGQMIGLGNSLQKAQNLMQPAIYELFGAAINGLNSHFGTLWQMGEKVIYMLDDFAAKVDVELRGALGQQLNSLVSKGAEDLKMFGEVLGNLGHALLNFAAAMPGLAEVLLKLLTALSDLLKIISEIPAPILTAAMAFEEFLRWGSAVNGLISVLMRGLGGLATALGLDGIAGALTKAGLGMKAVKIGMDDAGKAVTADMTTFSGFAKTIIAAFTGGAGMAAAVTAWGALVAVAIGAFVVWAMRGKSATDQWVASIDKMVQTAPDFSQVNTTIGALAQTNQRLSVAQDAVNSKMGAWNKLASGAQENYTALHNESQNLVGDITKESENVGILSTKLGVSMPTAIAIASGAGVKLTDVLQGNSTAAQVNWQKIQNLLAGYRAMDQSTNQVVSDINMVTIANSGLLANINKLNSAWSTVIKLGQGAQTGFIGFAQGLKTISGDAQKAGASLDGINAQSLTLRSDFQNNITQMSNSLASLNQALGIGGLKQSEYNKAVATMVKEMLAVSPASAATAAQLGLIASSANYTGNSYSQLSAWANKYGGTQSQLNQIMDKATIGLSDQNKMVQQLQGSIQSDVINTTAQAVLAQGGFQAQLNKTYDSFKNSGATSHQFAQNLSALDKILRSAGMSTQQVQQYNAAIIKSWDNAGVSAQSSGKKTGDAFRNIGTSANGLRDQIKNVFIAIGHEAETIWDGWIHYLALEAKQLWNTIGSIFKLGIDIITGHWSRLWGDLKQVLEHAGKNLLDGAKAVFMPVEVIAKAIWDSLPASWRKSLGDVGKVAVNAFNDVKKGVEIAWKDTINFLKNSVNDIKGAWDAAWGWVKRTAETAWRDTVNFIKGLGEQFDKWWKTHGDAIKAIWNAIWGAIKSITVGGTHAVLGVVEAFWTAIERTAKTVWSAIGPIVKDGWNIIKAAFDLGMTTIKAVWSIGWATFKAIITVTWAAIKSIVDVGWAALKAAFDVGVAIVKAVWNVLWAGIKAVVLTVWDAVKTILKIGWDAIVALFSVMIDVLTGHWHQAWVDIKSFGEQFWNAISSFFRGAWDAWKGFWEAILHGMESVWSAVWNAIKSVAETVWHAIEAFFRTVWDAIKNVFTTDFNALKNVASGVWNFIKTATENVWNGIWSFLKGIFSTITGGFQKFVDFIKRIWHDLTGALEKPIKLGLNIGKGIAKGAGGILSGIGHMLGFAEGGKVPGAGSGDIVPAMLEPGETVVSKAHSKMLTNAFEAVGVPGYRTQVGYHAAVGNQASPPPMGDPLSNLRATASFLRSHGYSPAAAAGVASVVFGSSGGKTTEFGTGGSGLLGFNPGQPGAPVKSDLNTQMNSILSFNNSRQLYIADLQAFTDPVKAAAFYSDHFTRPATAGADVRPAVAAAMYSDLTGGSVPTESLISGTPQLRTQLAQATVAHFDSGGVLKPGVTIAVNNTGMSETVVAPHQNLPPTAIATGGGAPPVIRGTTSNATDQAHVNVLKQTEITLAQVTAANARHASSLTQMSAATAAATQRTTANAASLRTVDTAVNTLSAAYQKNVATVNNVDKAATGLSQKNLQINNTTKQVENTVNATSVSLVKNTVSANNLDKANAALAAKNVQVENSAKQVNGTVNAMSVTFGKNTAAVNTVASATNGLTVRNNQNIGSTKTLDAAVNNVTTTMGRNNGAINTVAGSTNMLSARNNQNAQTSNNLSNSVNALSGTYNKNNSELNTLAETHQRFSGNVLPAVQNASIQTQNRINALSNSLNPLLNSATDTVSNTLNSSFSGRTLPQAQTQIDNTKRSTDNWHTSLDPQLSSAVNSTSNTINTFKEGNLTNVQNQIDKTKNSTNTFHTSLDPQLTEAMGNAGSSANSLRNNNINPLDAKIVTTHNHTDDLHTSLAHLPKNTPVAVTESATGTFKVTGIPKSVTVNGATGMKVPGGYGGGDIVPAMLEPGEAVVPKHLVRHVAPFLGQHNVPGFAAGGYVNPIGRGAIPTRIDQGVDFQGAFNVMAMGNGVIVETSGGGWPGGPYMAYRLTSGPDAGKYVYVAENIRPTVHVGQTVSAGQVIANVFAGGTGIETGWADPSDNGASPLSQNPAAGSISGANLPGSGATNVGKSFDNLIVSLGAPLAPNYNTPAGGKLPQGYPGFPGARAGGAVAGSSGPVTVPLPPWHFTVLNPDYTANPFRGNIGGIGQFVHNAEDQSMSGYALALEGDIKREESAIQGAVNAAIATGQSQIALGGSPSGPYANRSGGLIPQNAQAIANFLGAHGLNKIAVAGILGNIFQESGGVWNIGGGGLIQILGANPRSLQDSLNQTLSYINANGSVGDINAHSQNPAAAATWFSDKYERPGIPALANRIASAQASYAAGYDRGGWLMPGWTMAFNGTGKPERVTSPSGAGPGGGDIHVHVMLNDKELAHEIFPALQQEVYRYNSRNSGNGNINGTWRPL